MSSGRKQDTSSLQSFGGASLLVIFGVLCLTVFALLSLSTVQAQKRLSDSSLEAVEEYYAADLEAERILARLRAGEVPEGVAEQDGIYSYSCPVSQAQTLYAEVTQENGTWTVLRWQVVAKPAAIDDSLPVWTGK